MGRRRLITIGAVVAVIGLAVPAASSANDTQLGTAICNWNHALTKAGASAPNLQKTNSFGKFKPRAVAWAKLILGQDAVLRRALQRTKASSGTGSRVRTALLTKILPGIDAGARMVVSGSSQHPDTSAAKTMGTGIGKVVAATLQLLRVQGIFTWLPKGCFTG